ncbi:hypothetical protein [Pectobacterium parmentieri]|uniref:hypothetical protein n=1 Tax=Pectobacterium parmentieri TaxID=1905730 RepID=UPI0018E0074E|nr:hypothetical protein [Pectobacterium parmentieri]MBI0552832.1 hypothetical protein [Pectobacterium parmentieri]MBI0561851.1 hypothetical protein [Pectobacterium parmentieri]MBI0566133.1 hypothetical protein [Pectobacterium parmentieri]
MKVKMGKMFSHDNIKLQLNDLVKIIPDNNWIWYLYEIDGIGCALYDLSMPDFENLVLSEEYGLKMTWNEVKLLANSLDDIKTFFIVASSNLLSYEDVDIDELTNCFAVINVFDSSHWEIKIK